jgi:hypothetical protein
LPGSPSQGQAAEQRGAARDPSALKVGDKVEARFRGGRKFFAGTISAVNRDGTYDVRYDDGDKEASIPAEDVRKPGANLGQSEGAKESQVSPSNRGVLVEGGE